MRVCVCIEGVTDISLHNRKFLPGVLGHAALVCDYNRVLGSRPGGSSDGTLCGGAL